MVNGPTITALLDARDKLDKLIDQWARNTVNASDAAQIVQRVENDLLTARHNMELHAAD